MATYSGLTSSERAPVAVAVATGQAKDFAPHVDAFIRDERTGEVWARLMLAPVEARNLAHRLVQAANRAENDAIAAALKHPFEARVNHDRPAGTFGSECCFCGEGIMHPNHDKGVR